MPLSWNWKWVLTFPIKPFLVMPELWRQNFKALTSPQVWHLTTFIRGYYDIFILFPSRRYRGKNRPEYWGACCWRLITGYCCIEWYSILTGLKANHQSWYNYDLWMLLMAMEDQHTKPKSGHALWRFLTVTTIRETDNPCMGSHSKAQVTETVQSYCTCRCKASITKWWWLTIKWRFQTCFNTS